MQTEEIRERMARAFDQAAWAKGAFPFFNFFHKHDPTEQERFPVLKVSLRCGMNYCNNAVHKAQA